MATKVLVVDDSQTIRRVVFATLTRAGYEVSLAVDGANALQLLEREVYGLALVDFVMPRMNGFELCRKIRELPELKNLPVVLMSAKADKIREHFLRQTGALDAISKPFDPRALLLTIESTLSRAAGGAERRESTGEHESTSESTLTEPGHPTSLRPPVPPAFTQKISDLVQKVALDSGVAKQGLSATQVRELLGDELLSSSYFEIVGVLARAILSGDLGAIPLAEVLSLLQMQQQTGVLTIFDERTEVQVAMRNGLVDLAVSRGASSEFRLGRYVVDTGKLGRDALESFLERERASGKHRVLGDALLAEGVLTVLELRKALERQTCELIYEVLRWTRGRFHFDQKANLAGASNACLGLPIASIVMEGFRRVDEWRLMEGSLGDFDQIFYRDTGAVDALGEGRLSKEERSVLEAVDGQRNVRELIDALRMGSFEVCKILYQLSQSRLVRKKMN